MCGLIGYSGKTPYNIDKIVTLMLLNMDRGIDAAGFYKPVIPRKKKLSNYIIEKDDNKFCKNLVYDKDINTNPSTLFIGHCRQSSYGAKTKENAHPFVFKNNYSIVGAHNGTLTSLYELREYLNEKTDKKYEKNFNVNSIDVDSKIFPTWFSIKGFDDLTVLEYYTGAAALLLSETGNMNTLYAYTDHSRPLHYGYINDNMYISSEKDPLEYIGCVKITSFPASTFCKIENGVITEKRKVAGYIIPKKESTRNYYNSYGYDNYDDGDDYRGSQSVIHYPSINNNVIKHNFVNHVKELSFLKLKPTEINNFNKWLVNEKHLIDCYVNNHYNSANANIDEIKYSLDSETGLKTVSILYLNKTKEEIPSYGFTVFEDLDKLAVKLNTAADKFVLVKKYKTGGYKEFFIKEEWLKTKYNEFLNKDNVSKNNENISDEELDMLKSKMQTCLTSIFEIICKYSETYAGELPAHDITSLNQYAKQISDAENELENEDSFNFDDIIPIEKNLTKLICYTAIGTSDELANLQNDFSELRDLYFNYVKDLQTND